MYRPLHPAMYSALVLPHALVIRVSQYLIVTPCILVTLVGSKKSLFITPHFLIAFILWILFQLCVEYFYTKSEEFFKVTSFLKILKFLDFLKVCFFQN